MYINNQMAMEKLKSIHEQLGCTCDCTTNKIIDYSREDSQRAVLMIIKGKELLGDSYTVHGEPWLTEFLVNLQINGMSELNRKSIKRVIKDESLLQIAVAVEYFTQNNLKLSPEHQIVSDKLTSLMTWIDEEKEKLIKEGHDPEVIEHAMNEVMKRRFK